MTAFNDVTRDSEGHHKLTHSSQPHTDRQTLMAEARAIHDLQSLKGGVSLQADEEGVHISVGCTIPSWNAFQRRSRLAAIKLRNFIINGTYPLGPLMLFLFVAGVTTTTVLSDANSWMRSGPVASLVWDIGTRFPWMGSLPRMGQIGVLAAWTGLIAFLLFLVLQRLLLRTLFSQHFILYTARGTVPWTVKLWVAAVRLVRGRRPMMHGFSSTIPELPVPDVKDTVKRYLLSVRPLQNDEEYAVTVKASEEFLRNEGPRLQRYLKLKALISPNYVTDWWEKYVYLKGRGSIMINSNYYAVDCGWMRPSTNPCARLGAMLWYAMEFRTMIEDETVPPMLIQDLLPLCMHQYRRMFSTTRIPGRDCDTLRHYEVDASQHVAVFCKGYWFTIRLYRKSGQRLSPGELQQQFEWVRREASSLPPVNEEEGKIAALTAENRTRWAEVRETYFMEGVNLESLRMIESAVMVCILDDSSPDDFDTRARQGMHGLGYNVWFDKSINVIAHANGAMNYNVEHSWADAPVVSHMLEWASTLGESAPGNYDAQGNCTNTKSSGEGVLPNPVRLTWSLSTGAREAVRTAVQNANNMIADLDLRVFYFSDFGKGFIKKLKISPDAFVQLALQVTYYKNIGKFHATYESSMTRLFKHGRTETIRPCTIESSAFVRTYLSGRPGSEILAALRKAADKHVDLTRDSMTGKGVDRHLFALYVVSVGKEIDSPFLKMALKEPWRLSTSQQPQAQTGKFEPNDPNVRPRMSPGGGFGPVADDGYGVSYMLPWEDSLCFHISSKHSCPKTSSEAFGKELFNTMRDLRKLLEPETAAKKPAAAAQ